MARTKKYERDDFDFYREEPWVAEAIFDELSFGHPDRLNLIWDPCCGTGSILDVAKRRGHETIGGDIVDRKPRHDLVLGDILRNQPIPKAAAGREISIITNPPFGYVPDIAEKIIRHLLERVRIHRAVFIVPLTFLTSETRWPLFAKELCPSHVLIYSQRPTIPPGNLIDTMANPFKGGQIDYCAICFTGPSHRWRSEIRWMKPRAK